MSEMRNKGRSVGEAFQYINWFESMEALVRLPFSMFAEYVPDGNRDYERGEVVRSGCNKWLLQGNGRLDPNKALDAQSLLKLLRDSNSHDPDGTPRNWHREEYCLKGFQRYYDDGDPGRTGWYEVISERVDSATNPNNDMQNWRKVED